MRLLLNAVLCDFTKALAMAQKCPGESQPFLSELCSVPFTPSPGFPGTDLDFLLVMVDLPGDVHVHSTPLARFLEKQDMDQ